MLVNFCDSSLRTDVTCSTVSTEGYEVENLVNNSEKGFLAYACIKPPVSVDFSFICNIQINHVIVWPQTGAQKSCGFQLSVKSTDSSNQPFTDVSTAYLKKEENGVLFYRRDIANYEEISVPSTFLKRYIKTVNVVNYVNVVRLRIVKTENSVPAIGKIEIWGTVSPKCGKDVASNVMSLWINRHANLSPPQNSLTPTKESTDQHSHRKQDQDNLLHVPEDFLDPITCEIMTQPIILPSGKIIDQKTLEKHGHTEAIWGRPVSDPFTGIRFSESRKPVAAFSLKARIDRYLLENSSADEVKQLPRVLGSGMVQQRENVKLITCETLKAVNTVSSGSNDTSSKKRLFPSDESSCSNVKRAFYGHSLPVASVRNYACQTNHNKLSSTTQMKVQEIAKQNNLVQQKLHSSVQVSSAPTCKCCKNSIFYKLPCDHIICRKALLSLDRNECSLCQREFERSNLERFHLSANINNNQFFTDFMYSK